jgi:hypothetical protein
MPHHKDWWSAFDVIQPWRRQWKALTRALGKLEDLREEVLGCLTPEGTMPPCRGARSCSLPRWQDRPLADPYGVA